MTKSKKIITVKPSMITRLRNNGMDNACVNCGDKINVGESILSRRICRRGWHSVKWHHVECAKRLNII